MATELKIAEKANDKGNTLIEFPKDYLEARTAVKEVIADKVAANPDAKFGTLGGFITYKRAWFVNGLTDADTAKITAAADKDAAKTPEQRASALEQAAADQAAEKEARQAAAKEKRAEAGKAAAQKRDDFRFLVDAGSIEVGEDHEGKTIEFIGKSFEKGGKDVAYAYFGEMGKEMAERAAAKKEAEPSM